MIRTYLISESIRPGARFESDRLRLISIQRRPQGNAAPHQPKVWTHIVFGAEEEPDHLASALSEILDDTPLDGVPHSWYTDFTCRGEKFVIFPKRVFRYPVGDRQRHEEAAAYARSIGVPAAQADWDE